MLDRAEARILSPPYGTTKEVAEKVLSQAEDTQQGTACPRGELAKPKELERLGGGSVATDGLRSRAESAKNNLGFSRWSTTKACG